MVGWCRTTIPGRRISASPAMIPRVRPKVVRVLEPSFTVVSSSLRGWLQLEYSDDCDDWDVDFDSVSGLPAAAWT